MKKCYKDYSARKVLITLSALAFISIGSLAPQQISFDGIKYKEASAFLLKAGIALVSNKTKFLVKKWLKSVAKREGKQVALAGAKALTKLPGDPIFQTAIVVALTGKDFTEAGNIIAQTAKSGAQSQWSEDKKRLAQNPNIIAEDFENHVASEVSSTWNDVDDELTCGSRNIDIGRDESGEFYVANSTNETLLEGRAMLQRALFIRMMSHSNFTNESDAQLAANRYASAACKIGASRKAIAFLGGLALNKGEIYNSTTKAMETMNEVYGWAQEKLK